MTQEAARGDIDLTPALKNKLKPYPRTRGRYNSSELYAIKAGWTKPEDWINPPERTVKDVMKMWNGIVVHDHIERLLPTHCNEIKREHYHKGIILVAKADHVPENTDEVWEFKSSHEEMDKAKEWHEYQAKLYCSIFKRPHAAIFQPVQDEDKGLFLKRIGTVDRDDAWFEAELDMLYKFHERVEMLFKLQEDNK